MPIFIFPIVSLWKFKVAIEPKYLSNGNKNTIFKKANIINNSAKFQLYPLIASEEFIFLYFFFLCKYLVAEIKLRGLV